MGRKSKKLFKPFKCEDHKERDNISPQTKNGNITHKPAASGNHREKYSDKVIGEHTEEENTSSENMEKLSTERSIDKSPVASLSTSVDDINIQSESGTLGSYKTDTGTFAGENSENQIKHSPQNEGSSRPAEDGDFKNKSHRNSRTSNNGDNKQQNKFFRENTKYNGGNRNTLPKETNKASGNNWRDASRDDLIKGNLKEAYHKDDAVLNSSEGTWEYSTNDSYSKNAGGKASFHKTKSGSNYRKSESFVSDRRENKEYSRRSDSSVSKPFSSQECSDPEYQEFCKQMNKSGKECFNKIEEIEEDLFNMPDDYSLGHCVAADMRMGSGIAVNFKKQFGKIGKLLSQNQTHGGLAILELESKVGKRIIYYLVTKKLSTGKPTYVTLWCSLKKMRDHIRDNAVKKLAIPKIGCGLDRLDWDRVKDMIEYLFKDIEVDITVCNYQQNEDATPIRDYTCKVVYDENPVAKIDVGTIIIYFSTEKGEIDEDTVELSKKFEFIDQLKKARKIMGDTVRFDDKSKNYILYGCIVRKTLNSPFDFASFSKCLLQIKKENNKDLFDFIAYQSIIDKNDDIINEKIITLLRNLMRKVDVYVCSSGKSNLSKLEE